MSPFDEDAKPDEWWLGHLDRSPPHRDTADHEPPRPLRVIDPRDWEGAIVPDREWLVDGIVPARTVSTVSGDGAAGKSTLALQLAVARALAMSFLGLRTNPGRTLYLSAEDEAEELHRRLDSIRKHYGAEFRDLGDLGLIDLVGQDAVLGALDRNTGKIQPTALYAALTGLIPEFRPTLLIIDALADAFAGIENDRQQARQFVGLIKRLCREFGVTTIIIAHPSESGMASGTGKSGSTAWSNSVRSRLYFETDKATKDQDTDPDLRTLTLKKSNYGPQGGQFRLRYNSGAFALQGGGSLLDRNARDNKADRVFLELLRLHIEQRIGVGAKPSKSYAPTVFAEHIGRDGISKHEFKSAMQRLLNLRIIEVVEEGPPSKRTQRLVIVDHGRE